MCGPSLTMGTISSLPGAGVASAEGHMMGGVLVKFSVFSTRLCGRLVPGVWCSEVIEGVVVD